VKWTVYGTRRIYDNPWVSLDLVDVELPDGQRFEHHVVRLDPVAATVIVDDQEQVLLLWRHRFIVDTWGYELPTGIVEAGESPAETALREAVEETGWRPRNLTPLISYYPCVGIASAHHHLFVADGADRVGEPTDQTEADEIGWHPLDEIPTLIDSGQIQDAVALVGLQTFLRRRGIPR
jgi:8-oxo-dGTP pyrophosphatase MutT (NUDIX family)